MKVQTEGKGVGPGDLALYYDVKNSLTAESGKKGVYTLTMSDGTEKSVRIDKDSGSLPVSGAWTTANKDEQGFSVFKAITFPISNLLHPRRKGVGVCRRIWRRPDVDTTSRNCYTMVS